MSSAPDLDRVERLVWDLISAPTGVGPGAADLVAAGTLSSADLSSLVRPDDRLDATERLDIYADMYFYRLRDALAEDFPKLRAVIGGARFHNLATDYLLAHPSGHWSLRYLGEALPAYLERHASRGEFPFLADLARLEWARVDVFDEADAPPLTRGDLTRLPPEAVADLGLRVVPAFRLLDLAWSVAPLWRRVEDLAAEPERHGTHSASVETCEVHDAEPLEIEPPAAAASSIRVYRKGFAVHHRTVREDERRCLIEMAAGGASLPRVGELVFDDLSRDEGPTVGEEPETAAARRVAQLVESWLEDGILSASGAASPRA
ncbi:MAG: putative DNA-binding domain-containing protein [Acidobacteria bacterium]|nr:putative DNA-binding domain-containing protein [Acidobacteriota bacterium]